MGRKRKPKNVKKILEQLDKIEYTGKYKLRNDKHELFCQEYLVDLNQTQAAIRAGYDEKNAGQTGSELMKNPRIIKRIEYLKKEREKRTQITADKVVQELAKIAFSNILDFVDVNKRNITFKDLRDMYELGGVIQEIGTKRGNIDEIKIKLHDKVKALDMLMKHLELYERARLEIAKARLELEKKKHDPQGVEYEDDGFIEAMQGLAYDEDLENIEVEGVDDEDEEVIDNEDED